MAKPIPTAANTRIISGSFINKYCGTYVQREGAGLTYANHASVVNGLTNGFPRAYGQNNNMTAYAITLVAASCTAVRRHVSEMERIAPFLYRSRYTKETRTK